MVRLMHLNLSMTAYAMNSCSVLTGISALTPRICGPVPNSVTRDEILVRIVANLLEQRRQRKLRPSSEQERVTVGRRTRDLARGGDAAGAATVLNDEWMAELRGEPVGGKPRHHVGIPAGHERHDDGHRLHRPGARAQDARWHCEEHISFVGTSPRIRAPTYWTSKCRMSEH